MVLTDDVSPRSRPENENVIKQLNEKLKQTEQRSAEQRNQVQTLKTELKMAQKVSLEKYSQASGFEKLI